MKDILLNENGDLAIENGDFVVGESDKQNVEAIILAFKGEFKQHPLVGFGAMNYIKSNVTQVEFKRDLKLQLEHDGYDNPIIDLSNGFQQLKVEV